jgi:hypothetical protein
MFTKPELVVPCGTYPTDVTSPGPDQRPGVAKSQRTKSILEEPKQPLPEKGDKPIDPSENK